MKTHIKIELSTGDAIELLEFLDEVEDQPSELTNEAIDRALDALHTKLGKLNLTPPHYGYEDEAPDGDYYLSDGVTISAKTQATLDGRIYYDE